MIVQDYENGGLKMIDLVGFINALKANWVKRLINRENRGQWKSVYMNYLNKFGGVNIFEGNFHETDAKMLLKNTFLTNILESCGK